MIGGRVELGERERVFFERLEKKVRRKKENPLRCAC